MNLYLIQRQNGDGKAHYDSYWGFVIRADTEQKARDQAARASCDEGPDIWYDPETTVDILAVNVRGRQGIVLSDFDAG